MSRGIGHGPIGQPRPRPPGGIPGVTLPEGAINYVFLEFTVYRSVVAIVTSKTRQGVEIGVQQEFEIVGKA